MLLTSPASGQSFQKTHIRDIAKMKNNFGNAVADYDRDGDLDIFIVAYEGFERGKPETWSRLLKNNGSGWFEDVTIEAGFGRQYSSQTGKGNKLGVAWGDYDNDGYPDLLLTHAGHVELYWNRGNGTFKEVTVEANISACPECVNTGALWWDYDRDGLLDFYLSDYQNANRLYRNNGDGSFSDATAETGLADGGSTWCSIAFDVNRDGWLDLYVVNDYSFSRLYLNRGEGQYFQEATTTYGLRNTGSAMGISVGDYNNDGYFDIYVSNISELQPNPLFTGSANGVFSNDYEDQKVGFGNWGWGTHFLDADHDGDEDLYVVNGFEGFNYTNKFFKNNWVEGKSDFSDWSERAACNGDADGMGLEVFDYDNDGDLDMLVSNSNSHPYFYQNTGRAGQTNWLQVELDGTTSNRNAFGAIVIASGNGRSYHRYHHGAGLMAQSIKPVHFGLGDLKMIDTLTVIWPGNNREDFYNIAANQKVVITETPRLKTSTSDNPPQRYPISVNAVSPNPFTKLVAIEVQITQKKRRLSYQVFTAAGRLIFQENLGLRSPGIHRIVWDGTSGNDSRRINGLYFYRILSGDQVLSGKLVLKQ